MADAYPITQDYLKSILHYDPETGVWTWRWRVDMQQRWNTRWANKTAGCTNADGYIMIGISIGKKKFHFYAHRLAFLYMEGKIPPEVDHEARKRDDCRWAKLRSATHGQNNYNKLAQKNNISGYKGVWWHKKRNKWVAEIKSDRKSRKLLFNSISDAIDARRRMAEKYHGTFAHRDHD